jgi:hypothetical protein
MILIEQLEYIGNAHGEPVVRERRTVAILFVQLFLTADHVLNKIQCLFMGNILFS